MSQIKELVDKAVDAIKRRLPLKLRECTIEALQEGLHFEFGQAIQARINKRTVPMGGARQVLLSSLGIPEYSFLDFEIYDLLSGLEGSDIESIESSASKRAFILLKGQIERKNTFFIDVGTIRQSKDAILVEDIIRARRSEIEQLGKGPIDFEGLASTYYGFEVLTSNIINESIKQAIIDLFKCFNVELSPSQLKSFEEISLREVPFDNCTPSTRGLLREILMLSSPNSGKRAESVRSLCEMDDIRALPYIRRRNKDQYPWVRQAVARGMGMMYDEACIDVLIDLLGDLDSTVNEEAVKAIVRFGPRAIPYLAGFLNEQSEFRFQSIVESLNKIHPRSIDAYAAIAFNRHLHAKETAIEILGMIGNEQAMVTLDKLTRHENDTIRQAAERAIAHSPKNSASS